MFELGLPFRGLEEGELRLALVDFLNSAERAPGGLLLVVDEAHTFSWRLMDELRMITNLARHGEPRVRLVLAGGPRLEERFASPKMEAFSQRVAMRCYLESLTRGETIEYCRQQIHWAGGQPEGVFEAAALERVFEATDGVPRLINQLADQALVLGHLARQRPVAAATIDEAWADLQQLPAPWAPAPPAATGAPIEFGLLTDRAGDVPESIPFPGTLGSGLGARAEASLEQVEASLGQLDEEFRPAGTIGPEIDLVFDGWQDPFGDGFDEEEVLLDRFAPCDAVPWAGQPQVTSSESEELSALLAQFSQLIVESELAVDTSPALPQPGPDAALVGAAWVEDPHPLTESATAPPSGPPSPEPLVAADPADTDLIVIEEEVPATLTWRGVPPARRQEYRQLFAQLRRG
jgi:hypothetical protein